MRNVSSTIFLLLSFLLFWGCSPQEKKWERTSSYESFLLQYNQYVKTWLSSQAEKTEKAIQEANEKLATSAIGQQETFKQQLMALKRDQEKWKFRQERGDYFQFRKPEEIPTNLVWDDGMQHEEIGDPRAKKGGTFRQFIPTFPPTLRPFGSNSNNGFRGTLYDSIEIPLVGFHPKSMAMIPGLAKRWALSTDGKTVYFELDPEARYSDGVPVKAEHFLFGVYIRISDDIVNPYSKQFFLENIAGLTTYGEHFLSISLPEVQLYAPAICGSIRPSPPHFYKDYGPDYTERYQWAFPPTTGAYEVLPEDIVKGVSITQKRVKNWWAQDHKYYKYRFNPDYIVHTVVRDESKAFELFRAGEIDTSYLTRPEYWYEKAEMEPVFKGYIERYTFYNQYPDLPRGIYINTSKPLLAERAVRLGIQYAMNWQKVIDVIYRGDYARLHAFNQGYLLFSDPSIKARNYSIKKAREAFRAAGFTEMSRSGILKRPDGTLLSLSVSYTAAPILDRMFAILREEAKACGFDLRLDPGEATVNYKKLMLKQHEMAFSAWVIGPPTPTFHEFMHSTNARDERGNLKPQTNNLFVWSRADTDLLVEKSRFAQTVEELREITFKLQRIIHDEAIFVPAYTVNFMRMGSWRWVRWPDCEATRFSPPVVYDPIEAFVHWIDEEMKTETMNAKREGRAFEEVNRVIDDYRDLGNSTQQLEEEEVEHE